MLPYCAFPNNGYPPPGLFQSYQLAKVARDRFTKFFRPERLIGARIGRIDALLMPVPVAAVHLDGGLMLWEHDVRPSRKFGRMEPKAKPKPMKRTPKR